jgi:hypothetical protein
MQGERHGRARLGAEPRRAEAEVREVVDVHQGGPLRLKHLPQEALDLGGAPGVSKHRRSGVGHPGDPQGVTAAVLTPQPPWRPSGRG